MPYIDGAPWTWITQGQKQQRRLHRKTKRWEKRKGFKSCLCVKQEFLSTEKRKAYRRWPEWVARLRWPYKFQGGPRSTKPCVSVCASPAKFLISSCSYSPEDALIYKWRALHQQPVCLAEGSPWHVYISMNTVQKYHLEDTVADTTYKKSRKISWSRIIAMS